MGIKHFFSWYRRKFGPKNGPNGSKNTQSSGSIFQLQHNAQLSTVLPDIKIDNFMIDMNGLFHTSAQKVYEYGNFKPLPSLLKTVKPKTQKNDLEKQLKVFRDVCNSIEIAVNVVQPVKRLILCVDGPAPIAKQCQQRKRRFLAALSRDENSNSFDSNCITPGTVFMDRLTKYIDWYIRKRVSEDKLWARLEVIFSNEKVPGEGEHKCFQYVRKYGDPNETYCLHGMDADLIMLALGANLPNFYILREDQLSRDYAFFVINVGAFAKDLINIMKWSSVEFTFNPRSAIHDFIFMCFAVGNDFLPHIPAIEIIQDGIDFMLEVYKKTGEKYGHLTKFVKGCPRFSRRPVAAFLFGMSTYEKKVLENKMNNKADFLPNPLLEKYSTLKEDEKTYDVNLTEYRKAYYKSKFSCTDLKETPLSKICHDYLRGMQWVLTYYIQGPPDWKWQYEHHYAPFAYTLAQNIGTFTFTDYNTDTKPTLPFIQLLSVLPPKSAELLPDPLCDLLSGDEMAPLCPTEFKIDVDGCREEWEGTVILPIIDYATIEKLYMKYRKEIDKTEYKRNVMGKTFVYKHCAQQTLLKSFYGNFLNKSTVESVEV